MNRGVYAVLAMVLSLAGCNREAPPKTEVPRTANAPQATTGVEERLKAGEALFKQNCSPCHPDGGNTSDPERTLHGSALRAHHITTPEDIVRIMRHPISRMIRFDETTISEKDAMTIAEYILATFK